jgi:hypothetical protein
MEDELAYRPYQLSDAITPSSSRVKRQHLQLSYAVVVTVGIAGTDVRATR